MELPLYQISLSFIELVIRYLAADSIFPPIWPPRFGHDSDRTGLDFTIVSKKNNRTLSFSSPRAVLGVVVALFVEFVPKYLSLPFLFLTDSFGD